MLQRSDLPHLVRGYSVLGSGGGGDAALMAMLVRDMSWPIPIHDATELAPDTPCIAVGVAGSTYLLRERLLSPEQIVPLLAAAEQWTGRRPGAVCSIEGAGTNGLAALTLTPGIPVVDADLMGRALPRIDQVSLMVDRVPGLAWICRLRNGVVIVDGDDGPAAEALVRAAIVEAGGFTTVVLAGFSTGQLLEHAIVGGVGRALSLGAEFAPGSRPGDGTSGAHLVVRGTTIGIDADPAGGFTRSIEIVDDDGAVCRVVSASEHTAVLRDGRIAASCPDLVVLVDANTRDIVDVDGVRRARDVEVYAIPAPTWWSDSPHRIAAALMSAPGLD